MSNWIYYGRQGDQGYHFGVDVYVHRHAYPPKDWPMHFHILFDVGPWYVELQVGRDIPKGEE